MKRGLTLVEILVAAVILVVVAIPMLGIFQSSRQSIARTDRRREVRHIVEEVLSHAERQPLHELWDQYGPGEVVGFDVAGKMHHRLVELDGPTGQIGTDNPLGFTQDFADELRGLRLEVRLYFEFYTRKELGLDPEEQDKQAKADREAENADAGAPAGKQPDPGRPTPPQKPTFGILHMQAGYARVDVLDTDLLKRYHGDTEKALIGRWAQPIMCPAVVGRPGLKLASCPAVNPVTRAKYLPLLAIREGF